MRLPFVLAFLALAVPATAQNAEEGQALFRTHCATCHGLAATGDGPMASVLVIQPSNLTTLSQRNGGAFPLARVIQRIDGRDPLVSHGSPMPVYGDYFEGVFDVPVKTDAGQPILTSRPVLDLVSYLQSLQVK
ncbi:MAG: cytochrome c [Roseivivax sp.]|nr:cytochrome c [Roseivivax sp.]